MAYIRYRSRHLRADNFTGADRASVSYPCNGVHDKAGCRRSLHRLLCLYNGVDAARPAPRLEEEAGIEPAPRFRVDCFQGSSASHLPSLPWRKGGELHP